MPQRKRIQVSGIVQGVGFRPFVYRLAQELGLTGFVRNTTSGVDIEIEGTQTDIDRFLHFLQVRKPIAAVIDRLDVTPMILHHTRRFEIRKSTRREGYTRIAPDIATCEDCYRELYDPKDRRHKYPFINCTNCGPRYSIIQETPYDRSQTSMRSFVMCDECTAEFADVSDRRFHAQPDCCVICGPWFVLHDLRYGTVERENAIEKAADLIRKGNIVAIKGIGGFHIACDAMNTRAVQRLRKKKKRPAKPFAIMCDLMHARKIVHISKHEEKCLRSAIAPIVVMRKKQRDIISDRVAPNNPYIGIMMPYAPVHYVLLETIPYYVMTSGNVQDEPIVKDEDDVKLKLGSIVTHALTHNRKIENRCDDSVGFVYPSRGFSIIRRSRGYTPNPVELPDSVPPMLALGPYLKNTFTLARGYDAYVSPHIGDLDNMETLAFFQEMIERYQEWFRIEPEFLVHDLHPEYLSTRIAQEYKKPRIAVQHHIAHIVSCLGEHRVKSKAIGIAYDGTGYGLDGRIWGGEFFIGDLGHQERVAHLEYLPLPGGESSIRRPYRIAIAYAAVLCKKTFRPKNVPMTEVRRILNILNDQQFSIETSSMGRLFDCIAGMIGIVREITYEAEGAINLEHIAGSTVSSYYPYTLFDEEPLRIGVAPIIHGVMRDLLKGVRPSTISAKFHATIVHFSLAVVDKMSTIHGIRNVCLSGGVFQNRLLLSKMVAVLEKAGYKVFVHKRLPTNDGCISYGQVIYADKRRMIDKPIGQGNVKQ